MTLELMPVGVRCNLACTYCYENPLRDAGAVPPRYDVDAMLAGLATEGGAFTVFGGEPLLLPLADLERVWAWGLERYGQNSVQTNGALITAAHVDLFVRYRVSAGLSIDGPEDLNDARWAGSLERTRAATARSLASIDLLLEAGIIPSVIITLHRLNATGERLDRLKSWIRELDAKGVSAVRLHLLEIDHDLVRTHHALTAAENAHALLELADLELELEHVRFDLFRDIVALLRGDDSQASCVWHACDPYTTTAVRGVGPHGELTNCPRTNKDGVDWIKAERPGHERQLSLYVTPQEHGGCQGCRFFAMCKGQCPGTAQGGDWRRRSDQCEAWFAMFEHFERRLREVRELPVSLSPVRPKVEAALLEAWGSGRELSLRDALLLARGEQPAAATPSRHGDVPHGDHTDASRPVRTHGDHTDAEHPIRTHGDSLRVLPVGGWERVTR